MTAYLVTTTTTIKQNVFRCDVGARFHLIYLLKLKNMKKILLTIIMLLVLLPVAMCADGVADYNVVPLPGNVDMQRGAPFVLDSATTVVYPAGSEEMERNARFLVDYISETTGIKINATTHKSKNSIHLFIDKSVSGGETYHLVVGKKGVALSACSPKGIFYGIQTLRKALPVAHAKSVILPAAVINDAPRFGYRGMMLDCSRHFFSVDFVKRFIDMLALHNMNVMHWHLTDDQGWRIEIKKYPRLSEVASRRTGTTVGFNSMADDSTEYGGCYTQDEARQIVEYARQRFITVIPEIDMPGHMKAALTAYPELGCTGGPYEVGHRWGIYVDVLCLGNEKVYQFCEDVLSELMDIFPSQYIHIGGDETPTKRWSACPKCQALAKEHSLAASKMQGYFTNRIEKFVNSRGRRIIGWDEILEGDINQSATIMSWRGTANGEKASELGHDVIMSPTSHCYFDFQQTDKNVKYEPTLCNGFISVEKVYNFEPCPDSLSVAAKRHMLGVQANVWTEYITCPQSLEYQVLPRMAALCEVQWTNGSKDFGAFKQRLDRHVSFYDLYHWNYAKHLWPERIVTPWVDN